VHRVEQALSDGAVCLFLSPHLDDTVLSCGALIQALVPRSAVTVATAFTEAGPPPHTFAARSFLRQCAAHDADALFAARRAEDRAVLDRLGTAGVHLGMPDALFRRREFRVPVIRRLVAWCPELAHRYPTYRFDIALGRVSKGDTPLIERLTDEVARLCDRTRVELLFAPAGVGRHVDHLIARAVGERFPDRVVYYSDFPYDGSSAPDPRFIARHRLRPWRWDRDIAGKARLIRGYRSQVGALFPDGRIPAVPETYYVATPEPASPSTVATSAR
jgi:LmbE family N-acetylglucosaminyl deacetylase